MARKDTAQTEEVVSRKEAPETPEFSFPVDIYDREEEIVLMADLPGVPPNGVEINLDRGNLSIRGRAAGRPQNGERVVQEYRVGDYLRSFTVSEEIDPSGISAELKNGVLTLHLPKAEERKPRKIPVRTG